jgi:hypothetical protein
MIAAGEAVLLGDVGATNARFAVLFDEMLGPIERIEVASHPTFDGAVKDFLQSHGRDHRIAHALLAIAGPVKDDRCEFTNCPWTVDSRDLRNQFGFRSVQLVTTLKRPRYLCLIWESKICVPSAKDVVCQAPRWLCSGLGRVSALPGWYRTELATSSCQPKAATPRWLPTRTEKMRSSTC